MTANVAYDGTHADLGMDSASSLFSSNADLSLFGNDDLFGFTSVNDSLATPSTVSPQDLFMDSMSSVPSSTAFPELTPSSDMLATPDSSPWLFDTLHNTNDDYAFPLFPDAGKDDSEDLLPSASSMQRSDSTASQVVICAASEPRNTPAANESPMIAGHKPSASAGVRKRQKPLPAIVVDSSDPVALKRARNTAAARKSRERKEAHRDSLEYRIAELEALLKERDSEIALLKSQR